MSMIDVSNLTFGYEGSPELVFDHVSFQIDTDWKLGFTGRNGRGKTTLLRILLGLEKPDSGELMGMAVRWSAVFQEDRLLEGLDALGNLRFALGTDYEEAKAAAMLTALGLTWETGKPVREWSGGMKRRVALARALLYDAPLLVLDEPFKGLDETTARQCMDALARRAAGRAVLLVTHDAQEGDYLHARTLQMEKLQRV